MTDLIEQIKAAYAADQLRTGDRVFKASELPVSYEAITDAWLTDVLCGAHPGAKVNAHHLDAPDSGTSNRRRIAVEYNEVGHEAGLPTALFCKASHGLSNRIVFGLAGAAHSEVTFYNKLRPLLNIEAPQSFFARLDDHSFNSLIMLRDLSCEGAQFCTHETRMTRQRVESQLALLAELHGKGYSQPEVKTQSAPLSSWPEYFGKTLHFGMREGSELGFQEAQGLIPQRLYRRHSEIWSATVESVERHNQLPRTLAHGDVHLKNWYIARNGDMGLSDWQCLSRAHWGRDFAYAVATALTVEDRRLWERELLLYYLDRLHAAGGPSVEFDEGWNHYRQQLMTALTWWTITLCPAPEMPDMQPRDITEEFIRRIATAMDDLNSLDSFH